MGEFDQLFGPPAPPAAPAVTIGVTGQDAAAIEAFCQCLAMMAAKSSLAPTNTLWPGLQAIQNVLWQLQTGLGLAAAGTGWSASLAAPAQTGRGALTFRGAGNELKIGLDSAGRMFEGDWQNTNPAAGGGTLTFTIRPGAGGAEFHGLRPFEFAIPLGAVVSGWTAPPPAVEPQPPPPAPAPPAAPPPKAEPPKAVWSLTVRNGPDLGKKYTLRDTMRLGRGAQSEIVLPDDAASRSHASIQVTPDGCLITDLGSTNGTLVNGVRIAEPASLADGDVISCGQTELTVAGPPKPPDFSAQQTVRINLADFAKAQAKAQMPVVPPPPAPTPAPWSPPAAKPVPPPPAATGSTTFCPFCGKQLLGAPKFCAFCGRPI